MATRRKARDTLTFGSPGTSDVRRKNVQERDVRESVSRTGETCHRDGKSAEETKNSIALDDTTLVAIIERHFLFISQIILHIKLLYNHHF